MYKVSDLGHILLCNTMLLSWLTSISIIGNWHHQPHSRNGNINFHLLDGTTQYKVFAIINRHIG